MPASTAAEPAQDSGRFDHLARRLQPQKAHRLFLDKPMRVFAVNFVRLAVDQSVDRHDGVPPLMSMMSVAYRADRRGGQALGSHTINMLAAVRRAFWGVKLDRYSQPDQSFDQCSGCPPRQ